MQNQCPLVSILIPAFKACFFEQALKSALQQNYINKEIIICDDSNDFRIKGIVEKYSSKYVNIKYYYNGGPLGDYGFYNCRKCLKLCNGEYVNYLMDDDLFHPDKISKMISCFLKSDKVSLVTSHRQRINEKGDFMPDIPATEPITLENNRFNGKFIANKMITKDLNFIGEPTTALFKKEYIEDYGLFCKRDYRFFSDVANWLALLSKGDLMYLTESLSYFRCHNSQNTNVPELGIVSSIDHLHVLEDGINTGLISKYEYDKGLLRWKKQYSIVPSLIEGNPKYYDYVIELKNLGIM